MPWNNIDGETDQALSLVDQSFLDHNRNVRCVATNAYGTASSNAALVKTRDVKPASLKQLLFAAPAGESVYHDGIGPIPDYYLRDFSLGQGDERLSRGQWCYNFDGVDDVVNCGNIFVVGTNDFSVRARFKRPASIVNNPTIVGKGAAGSFEWMLRIVSTNVDFYGAGGNFRLNGYAGAANTWYDVVVTREAGVGKLYVNNVLLATDATANYNLSTSDALKIGYGDVANRQWAGLISDVQLYDKALTTDEIEYLYTQGVTGTDPGRDDLHAHYPLQEEAGGIAYDISGNGRHGTHTNTSAGFHTTDTGVLKSYPNDNGYTVWENVTFTASGHQGIETDFTTGDCAVSCIWPLTGSSSQTGIGLSTAAANTVSYNTQVLGVKLDGSIIETGSSVGSIVASSNDIVTVRRTSNVLTVEVNGAVQYTKSGTTSGNIKAQSNTYSGAITNRYKLEGVTAWEAGSCALTSATPFYIPAISDTEDAIGGTPDYVGPCPYPGLAKGYAWDADGVSAYVKLSATALIPATTDWTIELSVYVSTLGVEKTLFAQYLSASQNGRFQIKQYSTNIWRIFLGDTATLSSVSIDGGTVSVGWHKLTVIRSGNTFTVKQNGVVVATHTDGSTRALLQTGVLLFARTTSSTDYDGTKTELFDGVIGYLEITTGGLTTTYYPRNGSTTVDVVKSDGTGTQITSAVQGSMTYTLGDGSWRLPAIENGGYAVANLKADSQNINGSSWTRDTLTVSVGREDVFGNLNAQQVAQMNTTTSVGLFTNGNVVFSNANYTISFWIKNINATFLCVQWRDTTYSNVYQGYVNLSTFAITNISAAGTVTGASIVVSEPNEYGWRRVSITARTSGSDCRLGLFTVATAGSTTRELKSYCIFGTQINIGDVALDYQATGASVPSSLHTVIPAAENSDYVVGGLNRNTAPGHAPMGLIVDRTPGFSTPMAVVTGANYTNESYNSPTPEPGVDKRRVTSYASDRYGAAVVDISGKTYFDPHPADSWLSFDGSEMWSNNNDSAPWLNNTSE